MRKLNNVIIDLENFLEVFSEIFNNLEALLMHYAAILEKRENVHSQT
ncbi:hypothetical protein ACQKOF_11605 [Lysinibacillus sp. NPDC093190]